MKREKLAAALVAFLLAASLLPLILTAQSEIVLASPSTFPVVAAENGGNNTSDSTEHTVNLPSGIQSGDLLLVIFNADSTPTITFPEGWTQLFQTLGPTTYKHMFGAWYRIADGEEGATITVTTSASEQSAHTSYRITDYSGTPEVGTSSATFNSSPNPPSLAPSWGAKDTLWFAVCGYGNNYTITAYPTDYTDGRNDYADSTHGCGVGSARRELNAASEDPGTFTLSGDMRWVANTVAIQPAELPPPAPGKPVLISPENQHSTPDNTPTFAWENGSGATSHRLVIDNSQGFDDGENIYDNASAWDNSGTAIENELPADNYWWRVCAVNAQGENWSENTWTFEITTPPVGVPLIVVPRVFASVYTKGESGTVWTQVLDADGNPVNTATVTLTVWKPDGTKYLDAVSMSFVTNSNGIYKYAITAPSEFGTFLCDVTATWNGSTAYGSGEFQVASWAEKITSILDNLITHRSAVEATISAIEGYVDGLESGQTTIIGYVDDLETGQTTIQNYVDTIEAVLGDPTVHGYADVAEALGVIDNFVDQLEGYTDTLESGQTTIKDYTDTLEGGQTTLMGYTDAVESNQQLILDNIDLLKQGQSTIEGYTDTLESGQSTITGYVDQVEGYTDQVEGWVDEIEFYMGVAAMTTDSENLYNYLKNTIVPYVDQVEGYTDQVEEYTDTLESGQSTITGYVDTLEGGQTTITDYVDTLETGQATIIAKVNWIADYLENTMKPELDSILDNVQNNYTYLSGTIKPQLDAMSENIGKTLDNAVAIHTYLTGTIKPAIDDAYNQAVTNYDYLTDTIKPQLDNIQENLTATAELPENIMDNIFATYSFLTENIKPELDNVYENVNASYNYLINTINPKLDEIAAGVGVGLSIEVTRYYQLNAGDLQEFYVTIVKGTNVDWVTITLEDPKNTLVVDNTSMSNPETGSYYHSFSTSGREAGGWLATIVAKDENLTTTYRGFWRLGGEGEAVGYLTLTLLDNETNEPVEGAKVELYKAGTLVESKYARWDGKSFLDIMNWGIHELKWSKDGYETETMEIDLAVSSELTLKIVPAREAEWPPDIILILSALAIGCVLTPLVYYGSKKKAGAGSLFVAFILPVLLLVGSGLVGWI